MNKKVEVVDKDIISRKPRGGNNTGYNWKPFTEESLLQLVDELFERFKNNDEFNFNYMLAAHGMYASKVSQWKKKSPAFAEKLADVLEFQQDKIVSAMLRKGSNINHVSAIFWLKTKGGFIDEAYRQKIESDKNVILATQKLIRIGFVGGEDGDPDDMFNDGISS